MKKPCEKSGSARLKAGVVLGLNSCAGGFALASGGFFCSVGNMTDDAVNLLIFVVIGVVVVGGLIVALVVSRRNMTRNLQGLATQLGLEFVPTRNWFKQPSVAGTRRGRPVQIYNYYTGHGRYRKAWSAVSAHSAGDGRLTFTLRKRDFSARLTQLFSSRPISTDDAEFDQAWFVQTNEPEFLRAALIPELRAQLMEVRRAGSKGSFELALAVVKYAETGYFTSAKRTGRFAALADVVCDLADMAEVAAKAQGRAEN